MDLTFCLENYGSQPVKKKYVKTNENSLLTVDESARYTSVTQFFRSVFLPQGYPESVSEDYLQYQLWDTVQAFSSSITNTLATQAVLRGVGVGDENATVLAATLTWLLKNGTGMVGQIMFTWIQGSFLDCDCKRWRLFADILNDFAIFLEILAPFFLDYFRYVICIAGVCKAIVGVSGGATRAALTQHQAQRNNMADVSAKDGSQETLVNLAGLICSIFMIPIVTGQTGLIWTLYILFTCIHLFANYCAVTSVVMDTFNQARLHIVTENYLQAQDKLPAISVKAANRREPVVWKTKWKSKINLGVSFKEILKSWDEFQKLTTLYSDSKYLLYVNLEQGCTDIVLHKDSTMRDQLQACYQAEIIDFALQHKEGSTIQIQNMAINNIIEAARHGDHISMTAHSFKMAEMTFDAFRSQCEVAGWQLSHVQLGANEWRAEWNINGVQNKKSH